MIFDEAGLEFAHLGDLIHMLRSLTLRNFRAFKSQSFDFGKLNIFVGPNNSGKSSAISAINMIAQTVAADQEPTPIVLNGQFDELGTYLDLVHGGRSNTPFGFDIEFEDYSCRYDYKYRQQRREIELVKFDLFEQKKSLIHFLARKDSFDLSVGGRDFENIAPGLRKRRPMFRNLLPASRFGPFIPDREHQQLTEENRERLQKVDRSVMRARSRLRWLFENFDSISPFRDKPQRTYLYSGETAHRIGSTGSNTAAILSSDTSKRGGESRDFSSEISRWFRASGIAEEVKIRSLTPRHFEIVVADRFGNEHNICDVGFGCSQVLPVLTASLNLFGGMGSLTRRPQPMLVVQEPEIHLHPNAQAALGSFFCGLLHNTGQIFIETHSDNLVLRVARHVAEGLLSGDDVKIFFVHKEEGQSVVRPVSIDSGGKFVPDWPGGFFPQRQSESLQLAQAAYRASTDQPPNQFEFKYPEEA